MTSFPVHTCAPVKSGTDFLLLLLLLLLPPVLQNHSSNIGEGAAFRRGRRCTLISRKIPLASAGIFGVATGSFTDQSNDDGMPVCRAFQSACARAAFTFVYYYTAIWVITPGTRATA